MSFAGGAAAGVVVDAEVDADRHVVVGREGQADGEALGLVLVVQLLGVADGDELEDIAVLDLDVAEQLEGDRQRELPEVVRLAARGNPEVAVPTAVQALAVVAVAFASPTFSTGADFGLFLRSCAREGQCF